MDLFFWYDIFWYEMKTQYKRLSVNRNLNCCCRFHGTKWIFLFQFKISSKLQLLGPFGQVFSELCWKDRNSSNWMSLRWYSGFLTGSSGSRGRRGGRYLITGCRPLKHESLTGTWEVRVKLDPDDVTRAEEWGRGGCPAELPDLRPVSVGAIQKLPEEKRNT